MVTCPAAGPPHCRRSPCPGAKTCFETSKAIAIPPLRRALPLALRGPALKPITPCDPTLKNRASRDGGFVPSTCRGPDAVPDPADRFLAATATALNLKRLMVDENVLHGRGFEVLANRCPDPSAGSVRRRARSQDRPAAKPGCDRASRCLGTGNLGLAARAARCAAAAARRAAPDRWRRAAARARRWRGRATWPPGVMPGGTPAAPRIRSPPRRSAGSAASPRRGS